MWNTPGPAPSSSRQSRLHRPYNSSALLRYFPSLPLPFSSSSLLFHLLHTVIHLSSFLSIPSLLYSRQHRSMDDPDGLYGMVDDSFLDPLSISTSIHPPPPSHLRSSAPLSNPISSSHHYWQQQQPTTAAAGFANSRYVNSTTWE